jgi:hypothetical protein
MFPLAVLYFFFRLVPRIMPRVGLEFNIYVQLQPPSINFLEMAPKIKKKKGA